MKKRSIPGRAAAVIIVAAVCAAVFVEVNALGAKDRRDLAGGEQNREDCMKCHSGSTWIDKIAAKEGKKSTDALFVDDSAANSNGGISSNKCPASDVYNGAATYRGK